MSVKVQKKKIKSFKTKLYFLYSDIGQNFGADSDQKLGQVHDERTVSVQAQLGVETSQGTDHDVDA